MAVPADAAIHITEAVEVQDAKPAPYCQVTGYVSPEVRFEVRLPLKTWTQRFVQTGCGGLCGNLNIRLGNDSGCAPAQNGELVLASTDMGHSGGMDVDWANGHPERVIDLPIAESMSRRWQPRRSPTLITAKNRNTLTSQAVRMGDGKR
jgi:hypothetical protein